MKFIRRLSFQTLLIFLILTLAACGGSQSDPSSGGGAVAPASLCVSSSCGVKTRLLDIPGAENTLFTPDGRLFVSGTQNTYEITKDAAGFHARPLFSGTCNFMGLAQVEETLYAACSSDMQLYAANLTNAMPVLAPIYHLAGFAMPNGMAAGLSGELYLADGPLSTQPKIVRLQIDPDDPTKVVGQDDWLQFSTTFPNGVVRVGNTLYITLSTLVPLLLGEVATIGIQPDGSPGTLQEFGTVGLSLPDDLSIVGDQVLVALYSEGAIALVGSGGVTAQTDPLSFSFPSSIKPGRAPMFVPTDLVVTEKGPPEVSIPPGLPGGALLGNALSLFQKSQ